MLIGFAQAVKEISSNVRVPFYLIAGNELYQRSEILRHLKKQYLGECIDEVYNWENFDGEGLEAHKLIDSLNSMPSLFDLEESTERLVTCNNFDKVAPSQREVLKDYFDSPSDQSCLVMTVSKLDKRKAWYKKVLEKGRVIEVSEPYLRDWPKWQRHFEKKMDLNIEAPAWQLLVEQSQHTLSVLSSDLDRMKTFLGSENRVGIEQARAFGLSAGEADVFGFAEDVVLKKRYDSLMKFQKLIKNGENEIKILALLIRQFRIVKHYIQLKAQGIGDPKSLASQVGVPVFFISKIAGQASCQSLEEISQSLVRLEKCDIQLKSGGGSLFESFLCPYFAKL